MSAFLYPCVQCSFIATIMSICDAHNAQNIIRLNFRTDSILLENKTFTDVNIIILIAEG